ncbi:hypothetical protein TREMEDRAFT_56818 [Tremella mesenterica DSM 1558]|uniref:uncharacterized protein n=1 Tax=Tremella mesenterica (strain ATCC 24925 / CBS 8224 / DSM 1558 / NBRC 9311 / NRRL Y-6157 / RJB 2259-6 / UBC 559-6) TaxID=578456 RepID=UPI0003F49BDB|nr:uncharacterized protein TREMEDRAFT_56818 [Tremella mesenterica DSM 1558]EIW70124.1 hypothetical protein TREMEDRAFT_56818 [Tremella mesenterica DSM 1558]
MTDEVFQFPNDGVKCSEIQYEVMSKEGVVKTSTVVRVQGERRADCTMIRWRRWTIWNFEKLAAFVRTGYTAELVVNVGR